MFSQYLMLNCKNDIPFQEINPPTVVKLWEVELEYMSKARGNIGEGEKLPPCGVVKKQDNSDDFKSHLRGVPSPNLQS